MTTVIVEPTKYAHLLPTAAGVADMGIDDRLAYLAMDRWLPYAKAERISGRLRDLARMPRVNRMLSAPIEY